MALFLSGSGHWKPNQQGIDTPWCLFGIGFIYPMPSDFFVEVAVK